MNKTTTALTKVIEDIDMVINSERFESSDADTLRKTIKMLQASAIYHLQKEREDMTFIYRTGVTYTLEKRDGFIESAKAFDDYFTQYKTEPETSSPCAEPGQ